jgi:hypothetical protein
VICFASFGYVLAQSNVCQVNTKHACVSRDQFKECSSNQNGILVPDETIYPCSILNSTSEGYVCYGGGNSIEDICGPAPPACTRRGNFAVPSKFHSIQVPFIHFLFILIHIIMLINIFK